MHEPLRHVCVCCLTWALPCLSQAAPAVDVCRDPADESFVSAAYHDNAASPFDRNPGGTDRDDFSTDVLFTSGGPWAFGGGHRSAILNVDQLEPQTNGYLHTFFFSAHRFARSGNRDFRLSVAPALSASSNITKDPDEYNADALQLLIAVVRNQPLAERVGLRYGMCGDHRFGGYRVYPVVGLRWQRHPDWIVDVGFPDSQLSYQASRRIAASLRLTPNGNEWYVKDKSLDKYSRFAYSAYLAELALDWRAREDVVLSASVGQEFARRYEMTLTDDSRVRLDSKAGARLGIAVAWLF